MEDFSIPAIYPITDTGNRHGRSHSQLADCYLQAGLRFFQVRDKTQSDRSLLRELQQIRQLCDRYGARFLVNDRLDLALACGADGVHLGQDDLPVAVARRLLGNRAIIGLSTHSQRQWLEGVGEQPDYLAVGPVFATSTKIGAEPAVGIDLVRTLSSQPGPFMVAIGGIDPQRARAVWEAGADSVAVISDINDHDDPVGRIQQYRSGKGASTP